MSPANNRQTDRPEEPIYREYILDVRIVEGGESQYRFEAPQHEGRVFDNPERAELYADVYFDVNGFEEAGTGTRGVPPVIIAAGRDTLAAYLLTLPGTDLHWVGSFFGRKPSRIKQYTATVQERAAEIRAGAEDRDIDR
jgi:hypothetical protein